MSTGQLVVVEEIAVAAWPGYSRSTSYISELGTSASPLSWLVNLSFALCGVSLLAGTMMWIRAGYLDSILGGGFVIAAIGVVLLSVFHLDTSPVPHALAANLFFAFGPISALATSCWLIRGDKKNAAYSIVALVFSSSATAGWVVHSTNTAYDKGLVQRWMVFSIVASVIALAAALRHSDIHIAKPSRPAEIRH